MPHLPRPRRSTTAFVVIGALTTAGVSTACGGPSAAAPVGTVAVVAAENVWGDITRQIGGGHVSVTSIITDPNADPHTYESDPHDASAITTAAFVIENGAGYDDFMDKILGTTSNTNHDVLNLAQSVGATGSNPNPHLWYSPDYVTSAARLIEAHLASHDPADAGTFSTNLQAFLTSYQPYVNTVATIRAKHAGSPIAYTERVPGYLVEAAGLRLVTPASFAQAIEDGNDPSPADTAAIDAAVSQRQVKVLLYNSQVTSPTTTRVRDLAIASGVPVVGVAETIPAGEPTFQRWQLDQAMAILAALGG
jgi:zinc/manganese transport system substrate-binding protein